MDGKPVVYEQATPFKEYDFRDVQIEVRLDHKASEAFEEAVISPPIDQLSQNEDEAESVPAPVSKDYNPQQAIEQLQSDLYLRKSKGEIKSTGFYPIYTSLLFIARIFLALAAICTIALVFYLIGMIMGPEINQEEDKNFLDKISNSNKPTEENEMQNV